MEPLSLALAVIALFKDIYLTVKWVHSKLRTVARFHKSRAEVAIEYAVQIRRLRGFWQLYTQNFDNTIGPTLLKDKPKDSLHLVLAIFALIKPVLATYSSFAAKLDGDYRKHCIEATEDLELGSKASDFPFDIDPSLLVAGGEKSGTGPRPEAPAASQPSWWKRTFAGSKQTGSKPNTPAFAWKELPESLDWLFREKKLRSALNAFRHWNDNLASIQDLNNMRPDSVQRVKDDPNLNYYRGHLELRTVLHLYAENSQGVNSKPAQLPAGTAVEEMGWDAMQELISASGKSSSKVLLEYKQAGISAQAQNDQWIGGQEERAAQRYVPMLAALLTVSGREFAGTDVLPTLPFRGYARARDVSGWQFVFAFDFPAGAAAKQPVSLHSLIVTRSKVSLNDRFHMAKVISRSLAALHNDRWLHKNIRSHAVKFFFRGERPDDDDDNNDNDDDDDQNALCDTSTPYLTDFSLSRPEGEFSAGRYQAVASDQLEDNVYRHPKRFGQPQEYFTRVHDVYSLGVVLLEIGLWRTAMDLVGDMPPQPKPKPKPKPHARVTGEEVKAWFVELARGELEHRMGLAYARAVLLCLDGNWNELGLRKRGASFATEFQKGVVQNVDGVRSRAAEAEAGVDWDAETDVGED